MAKSIVSRKIFLIFLMLGVLLRLDAFVNAQESAKIRVAIMDFTKTSQKPEHENLDRAVTEWLTTFLVETQAVAVVERRELEKVLQEQSLGQSGVLEAESAARVGKILGVNVLITGTVISVKNTLEITARLVDATNGAILGVASVTAENVDVLREQIKALAESIRGKLVKAPVPKDAKVFETFEESTFNTHRWSFEVNEKAKKAAQEHTKLSQEQGVLKITGNYQENDDNRNAWLGLNLEEAYQAIEVKIRVRENTGEMAVCPGVDWKDDQSWTGICLHFEKDYGNVTIGMNDPEDVWDEFDRDVRLNQWNVLRVEYKDAQFHYFWNNQLIKSLPPGTPLKAAEEFHWGVSFSLEKAKDVTVELDEVILK